MRGLRLSTFLGVCLLAALAAAQLPESIVGETDHAPADETAADVELPNRVEVEPAAHDDEIEQRLRDIMRTTGWFPRAEIDVREGIVFLDGETQQVRYREWADTLAQKTEGVVAVVNRMEITHPEIWDFTPAQQELNAMSEAFVRALPVVVLALIILILSFIGATFATRLARRMLQRRLPTKLLRDVTARVFGTLVFVVGIYLVLRVSGLTRLAVTVIGGTGLIGLILGIAFRDITENFLSSLLLSVQQPFRESDLVDIGGTIGYVQRLTSRTTVLTTFEGEQVQIPNSTVFKSIIRNYTSNPNHREDFVIGISYADSITKAQEIALNILNSHDAVLKDPEPWVLVDGLGASTVNLRIYFWVDTNRHSWLKVKSSLIRVIKSALQEGGISIPDEAREVVFPNGIPVHILQPASATPETTEPGKQSGSANDQTMWTSAEAGFHSDSGTMKEHAKKSWAPDNGENLLSVNRESSSDSPGG